VASELAQSRKFMKGFGLALRQMPRAYVIGFIFCFDQRGFGFVVFHWTGEIGGSSGTAFEADGRRPGFGE
jgi:hypothetical protein